MTIDLRNHNFDRRARRAYALFPCLAAAPSLTAMPSKAADDPLAVDNNLSDFIFSPIRAIGLLLLGFGFLQLGPSLKRTDHSQRANGTLTHTHGFVVTITTASLTLTTG